VPALRRSHEGIAMKNFSMGTVALGLLLASKQYLILAAPLVLLLPAPHIPRGKLAVMAIAAGVALLVSLPLVLWDVRAFVHSAVTLQFRQPFRAEALSYLVPLTEGTGVGAPVWVPFACAGVATLLALWRSPRTPSGFAVAVAFVLFAFFATSKQAFRNYYALVLAALCCGLAAIPGSLATAPRRI
jgi:hypothetical protein